LRQRWWRRFKASDAHTQANIVCTALIMVATIAYAIIAGLQLGAIKGQLSQMSKQLPELQKSASAAMDSAYVACLSARATQATFLQVQRSAGDSHAATAATIEQAKASIESERALLSFIPRIPTPNDFFNNTFRIPYIIKNDGKSPATSLDFRAQAVWLSGTDSLPASGKLRLVLTSKYIASGDEIPDRNTTDPRFHSMTSSLPVKDIKGTEIPASSEIASNFIAGEPGMVAILGSMKYTDFSGLHIVKFCNAMYVVKYGTAHAQDRNEKLCFKYNEPNDRYTRMPALLPLNATDVGQMSPITCVKPKD
jgi:hypothetical protein